MAREASRTLVTLSKSYQEIDHLDYEVLAIDNGSTQPLSEQFVRQFGPEFSYRYWDTTSVSPVHALNEGVRAAKSDFVIVMIDGAHMLTPGVVRGARRAFDTFNNPFAVTLPMHLGPGAQNETVLRGYSQKVEDEALAGIDWQSNGNLLFNLAGGASDASRGWFGNLFESSCFAMSKDTYLKLGGFDERFLSPGGGIAALDFFRRAVASADIDYVVLLGEASFHQVHGGVASNAPFSEHPFPVFQAEYERIRGEPYRQATRMPYFLGSLSPEALRIAKWSAENGLPVWQRITSRGEHLL